MLTDVESVAKKSLLEKEMDGLLYREEIMWLQHSHISWLREGDRNTKYFHRRASSRRKKNRISRLKRVDGSWTSDTNEMEMITRDFFQGLYAQDEHIDHSIITNLLISVWTMTQMRSSVHLSPRKKLVMLSFKLGR